MAKSSNYRVQLRRRREGKTDYQARKSLVISGKPRLVTRTANKNITVQILVAKPKGDQVLAAAHSRELVKKYGWKAATGNIPAAYLTGYLCGLKAKAAGVQEAILDIGLVSPTKGAKVFAALSGVVDSGVKVPHSEEKIVKERIKGDHIAKYAKKLGVGSQDYQKQFSQTATKGATPEKITEQFNKTKTEIAVAFNAPKPVPEVEEAEEEEEEEEFEEFEEEEEKPAPKAPAPKPAKEEKKPPKEEKPQKEAPKPAKEEAKEVKPVKEEAPAEKKAPAKKAAAKKEEAPVEEKAPAKKAAKKPAKEKAVVKEEKVPKAKEAAPKAVKEKVPKAKATKKGEKKE